MNTWKPQRATKKELAESQRRQLMMDRLSGMLVRSVASKVPETQADLLPVEDRPLAGTKQKQKEKSDARRSIMPVFLRRKLTKWQTILTLKALGVSSRNALSFYFLLSQTGWRIRVTWSSYKSSLKSTLGGWRKKLGSLTKKKNISVPSSSDFGGNTSATATFSRTSQLPESTSRNTSCEISRASSKSAK